LLFEVVIWFTLNPKDCRFEVTRLAVRTSDGASESTYNVRLTSVELGYWRKPSDPFFIPMEFKSNQKDKMCLNTIDTLHMDAVQGEHSGHRVKEMAMVEDIQCL
jgi:hypothetical protein